MKVARRRAARTAQTTMDLTKIRDGLNDLVHNGLHRNQDHQAELDQLIEALEQKEADLQQRLAAEKDTIRRHHLKIELKVTRLQHRKGLARRLEQHAQSA